MTVERPRVRRPARRRRRAPGRALLMVLLALAAALSFAAVRALAAEKQPGPPAAIRTGAVPAEVPTAATGLDPDLQNRFDAAAHAAAADGVELTITSGWRTADEQRTLIADAIATYGSEAEAHRYVLPPERSAHVQGLAIDVGPPTGAAWLEEHGAAFGLCRVYDNEPWHFEPLVPAGGACPPRLPDSSGGW